MPTSTDLIVIATARALPGKEVALEQALRAVAVPTRAQPGCVAWSLYRTGDTCVAVERWTSRETHDKHLQGPHVATLMGAMGPLLAGPPVILETVIIDEV